MATRNQQLDKQRRALLGANGLHLDFRDARSGEKTRYVRGGNLRPVEQFNDFQNLF